MSTPQVPRVLLDANILIALFFRRERYTIARLAAEGRIRVVLSDYVVAEARRMVGNAFRGREEELDRLLEGLHAEAAPAGEVTEAVREAVRDRADHPVLADALAAGVDFLVTSDRALREDAAALPVRVVSVPELVRELDA